MRLDFQHIKIKETVAKTDFEQQVLDFIELWFSESKTVEVKTSGSTGMPKIIQVEKDKMKNSAEMTCNFLELKEGNSAFLCLPVEYISGKMMMVRAMERKLKIQIGNTSLKPLENLTGSVDFCAMTPLQVQNSLDKIHLIKKLIIGGAKVSEDLKFKIQQTLSEQKSCSEVYETYGMSETLSHIALRKLTPEEQEDFAVFNGIGIAVDDRNCLQISAPELNAEVIQTNDIVKLTGDKKFRFLGRADFIINSGGLKISPEALEALVKKEISNELIFSSVSNTLLGEKLILAVEGDEDEEVLNKLSAIAYPTKNHKPKSVVFLKNFPRSENGKVLRLKVKEMIQKLLSDG